MRKSVLFTLMVAVLFALSACGDGDEAAETSATAPTPAAAPEPTAGPTAPAAQPTASAPRPTAAATPPAAAQATSQPAPPTQTPAPQPTQPPAPLPTQPPAPLPTQPPAPLPTQTPAPLPTQTPTPAPTATAQPEIAVAPEGEPEDTPTPVGFFLVVTEPEDETILSKATLDVHGMTTLEAIVTINGEPAEVDADGNFPLAVKLTDGPNVLEIVGVEKRLEQQRRLKDEAQRRRDGRSDSRSDTRGGSTGR